MSVHTKIGDYLAAQPERKRGGMQARHDMMLRLLPDGRLWFLDGRDEDDQTVFNANIGCIDVAVLEAAIRDGIARTSA